VVLKGPLDTIKMISDGERMNDMNMLASIIDGERCDDKRTRETIDTKRCDGRSVSKCNLAAS